VIEANYVYKKEDLYDSLHLTDEDVKQILALAKDDHIGERVRCNHAQASNFPNLMQTRFFRLLTPLRLPFMAMKVPRRPWP
jgi:hypothetical protein